MKKNILTQSRLVLSLTLVIAFILIVPHLPSLEAAADQQAGSSAGATVTLIIPKQDEVFLQALLEVRNLVTRYHTRDIDLQRLYEGALDGLMNALNDPYSQYMTAAELEKLSSSLEGEYVGIGVTIDQVGDTITVVSTFKGSPAERSGIRPGDIILSVDGHDLAGRSTGDAAALLRGQEGTTVVITVKRPRDGEIIHFTVTRAVIKQPTLDLRDLGNGIYYIKISQFTSRTGLDFAVILNYLRSRNLKGVILDLRDNPGGVLDQCIAVAKELVPPGPIVELRRKELREMIENDQDVNPVPTVVLVNRGTASASEIVAGAIRDRGVGILVGERTFGKGCVQAIIDLGQMGGIKLTIADYYTPSGKSISGAGLEPDVLVGQESLNVPGKIDYRRPLRKGLIGLDVLALQEALQFLGYDVGQPDGIFGAKTERACVLFSKDHNLPYNGQITEKQVNAVYLAVLDKARNAPDGVLEKGLEVLQKRLTTGSWQ